MKSKYSAFQKVLELAALIGLLAIWAYLIKSWDSLPDKIPAHYNGAGVVDRWGSKSGILLLPILGTIFYVLISLITFFPSLWNVPVQVTAENREFVYQNMKSLLIALKLELIGCFAYITYCDISIQYLGIWFLPFILIVIFGTIIYYTVKVRKRKGMF
jgi:Predicted membrane protein